ncbi:MAG TPA: hypothetical protein VG537_07975 [Candidatus Kapabacteria bacterium]|jgi:hypothetical protein|nr:hypothetical protein [Candidatus Kapabacteria bacterium]
MKAFHSFLLALAFGSTLLLASCADRMTDRHSEMKGGDQGPAPKGVRTYLNNGTPSNTDGAGRPLAGGKVNSQPDSLWNQNSPLEGKAF